MDQFRISPAWLVNSVIAVGLVLLFSPARFGWLSTICGITLLLILFTYDQDKQRSAAQSLAFSAVCALSFTVACGMLIRKFAGDSDLEIFAAATWTCATVIGVAIDRARMSGRVSPAETQRLGAVHPHVPPGYGLGLTGTTPVSAPPERAAAAAADDATVTFPSPVFAPESRVEAVQSQQPASPVSQPDQPSVTPPPSAHVAEEATIYVNVVGQGISLLRSVRAEHIARDIYRIVEPMPEGEIWRYQTGQVVRCRKQKLSSGKGLIAFEEVTLQRVS